MRRAWLGAVLSLVLLAGCGGKKSSSSTTTSVTASAATKVPSFSGSASSKYCGLARQFSQATSPSLSSDPKVLSDQFDALSGQFQSVAPAPIKADVDTVITTIKQLVASFKAANYDVSKINPADMAALQDPKFVAATQRVEAYDAQVCGITTTST